MKRISGIDILKIFSMFMIVGVHILNIGGVLQALPPFQSNKYYLFTGLNTIFYICVNCYALASGYLMVNSKFKISKILKLWVIVLFYLLLFGIIFNDKINTFYYFFPILSNQYWYFIAYVGLYFLSPFLNHYMIENRNNKNLKTFIILLIIIFAVLPYFSYTPNLFTLNNGYSVLWLVICYIIGAYIKLCNVQFKKKFLIPILFSSLFIEYIIKLVKTYSDMNGIKLPIILNSGIYTSVFMLLAAICLMLLFLRINIKNPTLTKFFSTSAAITFGIYIIQENILFRAQFIENKFGSIGTMSTVNSILYYICSVVIIYFVCHLIEFIRMHIFNFLKIDTLLKKFDKILIE
ncbi:acyltransferase [Breznakia pachnodae]|uniref:Surface polysaccharide O-acyltransferase-like enzyme n=1 Tax=Breznakia pachnodae TaxID=265178 RepID=A0ABU0DZS5_9FIRM|nr:acyltransferase family protein [Breznakia pachnodae]MDQ0359795.1 surface polysaccharide O-acyltransferase-like enzyme [Breznakia pachnodae]